MDWMSGVREREDLRGIFFFIASNGTNVGVKIDGKIDLGGKLRVLCWICGSIKLEVGFLSLRFRGEFWFDDLFVRVNSVGIIFKVLGLDGVI